MRFHPEKTADGSITLFDAEAGESYKSRHAAATEAEAVFFAPGVRENPYLGIAPSFRILELGFGLGTNFLYTLKAAADFPNQKFQYFTIERDLAGAQAYLEQIEALPILEGFLRSKYLAQDNFEAYLLEGDFTEVLTSLLAKKEGFHAIFFDPFSPKTNPEAWDPALFRLCSELLLDEGRLLTYSVSRAAKGACEAAGLGWKKRELPKILKKRNSLLAIKSGYN